MKKMYVFLRIRDAYDKLIEQPSIYAITSNTDHMKRFVSERNMEMFKMITCKFDKEYYSRVFDKYYKYELKEQLMYTRLHEDDISNVSHIRVLSTDHELEMAIYNKSVLHELCKFVTYQNLTLKKKYIDALTELYYFIILRYASIYECYPTEDMFNSVFREYNQYSDNDEDEQYINLEAIKNIINDEYAIFMYINASTFK